MNLLQIECFLAVAQYSSFSGASRARYISQPTMSKHIKNLENELGVTLFDRINSSVTLTPAGNLYYALFNDFTQQLSETRQKIKEISSPYSGKLKIGFLYGQVFPENLEQSFYRFNEKYPHVDLIFENHHYESILLELQKGNLDAIIHFSDFISLHEYLNYQTLFEIKKYLIYSDRLPHIRNKSNPTILDFKNCQFFVPASTKTNYLRIKLIQTCQLYGFSPHVVTLPNPESILSNVEFGSGVSMSDDLNKDINRKNLKKIEIYPPNQVCLAWQKNNKNESVKLLCGCLKEDFNSQLN